MSSTSYNTLQLLGLLNQCINDLNHILQGKVGETVDVGADEPKPTISEAIARHFNELFAMAQGVTAYATHAEMAAVTTKDKGSLAWVTNDPTTSKNGTYRWSGTAWVRSEYDYVTALNGLKTEIAASIELVKTETSSSIETFKSDTNTRIDSLPDAFVPMTRDGVISARPSAFLSAMSRVYIEGGDRSKYYQIGYFTNLSAVDGTNKDAFAVFEYARSTYATASARTLILSNSQGVVPTIDRTLDSQWIELPAVPSRPGLKISVLVHPTRFPKSGQPCRTDRASDPGYSWIVSPASIRYADGSLAGNSLAAYPLKEVAWGGVSSPSRNEHLCAALLDVKIFGARPGKIYKFYNVNNGYNGRGYAWEVNEYDADEYAASTDSPGLAVVRWQEFQAANPNFVPSPGINTIEFEATGGSGAAVLPITIQVTWDQSKMPPAGTPIQMYIPGNQSGAWIIDPICYYSIDKLTKPGLEYNALTINRRKLFPLRNVPRANLSEVTDMYPELTSARIPFIDIKIIGAKPGKLYRFEAWQNGFGPCPNEFTLCQYDAATFATKDQPKTDYIVRDQDMLIDREPTPGINTIRLVSKYDPTIIIHITWNQDDMPARGTPLQFMLPKNASGVGGYGYGMIIDEACYYQLPKAQATGGDTGSVGGGAGSSLMAWRYSLENSQLEIAWRQEDGEKDIKLTCRKEGVNGLWDLRHLASKTAAGDSVTLDGYTQMGSPGGSWIQPYQIFKTNGPADATVRWTGGQIGQYDSSGQITTIPTARLESFGISIDGGGLDLTNSSSGTASKILVTSAFYVQGFNAYNEEILKVTFTCEITSGSFCMQHAGEALTDVTLRWYQPVTLQTYAYKGTVHFVGGQQRKHVALPVDNSTANQIDSGPMRDYPDVSAVVCRGANGDLIGWVDRTYGIMQTPSLNANVSGIAAATNMSVWIGSTYRNTSYNAGDLLLWRGGYVFRPNYRKSGGAVAAVDTTFRYTMLGKSTYNAVFLSSGSVNIPVKGVDSGAAVNVVKGTGAAETTALGWRADSDGYGVTVGVIEENIASQVEKALTSYLPRSGGTITGDILTNTYTTDSRGLISLGQAREEIAAGGGGSGSSGGSGLPLNYISNQKQPFAIPGYLDSKGKSVYQFFNSRVVASSGCVCSDVSGYRGISDPDETVNKGCSIMGRSSMLKIVPNASVANITFYPSTSTTSDNTSGFRMEGNMIGILLYLKNQPGYGDGEDLKAVFDFNSTIRLTLSTESGSTTNGLQISWNPSQLREGWNFLTYNASASFHPEGISVQTLGSGSGANIAAANVATVGIQLVNLTSIVAQPEVYLEAIWTNMFSKLRCILGADVSFGDQLMNNVVPLFKSYGWRGYLAVNNKGWNHGSVQNDTTSIYRVHGWEVCNHSSSHYENNDESWKMIAKSSVGEMYYEINWCKNWTAAQGFTRGGEFYVSPHSESCRSIEKITRESGYVIQRHARKTNMTIGPWGLDNPSHCGAYGMDTKTYQPFSVFKKYLDAHIAYGGLYNIFWHSTTSTNDPGTGEAVCSIGSTLYYTNWLYAMQYLRQQEQAGKLIVCKGFTDFYYGGTRD